MRGTAEIPKKTKFQELEKFFEFQLDLLEKKGCLSGILESLQRQKGEVLAKALKMNLPQKGYIPFLPVISRFYSALFAEVKINNNLDFFAHLLGGENLLRSEDILDVEKVPYKLTYFIFNVSLVTNQVTNFKKNCYLTIDECSSFCLFTNILDKKTDILCGGSKYFQYKFEPGGIQYRKLTGRIRISQSIFKGLTTIFADEALLDKWVTPICQERF